ncbi:siderophore ABC transporter substrate-binding protein [Seohaeicola zhoushanensis]|uniref:Iron ABC transporter substrate-binding protein n=1 Tax=Seohaeicola zhoushanensis TaxID=1569283 RepID=A0A8J3H2S6_9RHOB|nr:siderophore ABC transporter substrate-binding protein [Seohaeicola zhoushanensis]GHF69626.1 iron ABC transporter substrate-binding protein [Seohaeicola zhoushanensis]
MRHWLSALCLAGLATAASAQTITVETARGEVTLPAQPQSVITLDMAVLDVIDSIGGTVAGIPAQTVSTYLSKYAETATPVGSPFEPDVEKIAALQPDLIIVAGRSAPKFDELSGIATVIDLTPDTTNVMPSIRRNAATLGAIYGKQEEAAAKVAALDEALAKVKAAASGRGTALTLLTTGARMSTHGDKGRFGLIYNEFGFPPAIEGVKPGNHGQPISFEFIRETNPDWIFVVDRDAAIGRDGQPAAQMLDNPMVAATTAAQKGQIVYLNPVDWYLIAAGITSVGNAAAQVAGALGE